MARPLRIDVEDGWHHVMNRGADHSPVFLDDSDRIEFGTRLADIHERFGVETHAYCLLDNHYHLLLHCPRGGVSEAMQRLGSLYTRHVNDRLGRDGALFRGRFHSKVIVEERHLLAATRYIHRNALDVAGVGSVESYRWSSHRAYLGMRRPAEWLRTDFVLSHFGGDRRAFERFIGAGFERPDDHELSESDVVAILEAANLVVLELGIADHGHGSVVARSVALAWADSTGAFDHETLMSALEVPSPGALRTAFSRARRRLAEDPMFRLAAERAAGLAAVPFVLHRGSDPWCNDYRAAT
jgi:REP element-mobilizing transposase RayT